jgi:hypothetical protein
MVSCGGFSEAGMITLSRMVKARKIKRVKLKGEQGSRYSVK